MRAALSLLGGIADDRLDEKGRRQRACLLKSFAGPEPPPADVADPWLASVIDAYRAYWTRLMLRTSEKKDAEAYLLARLGAVVPPPDAGASLDGELDALGAALMARGYHSIRGRTAPYYDLMVWKTEAPATYQVPLPTGPRRVEVVLLSDFQSLGWSAFATCGAAHTGGWAEKDRLYCVADSYDLASEHFHVSYLAHETEHFADYESFPKLEQPELEYRAKLVELIESRQTTRELVARFASQTGDSREAPHNYADGVLVGDLAREMDIRDTRSPWWQSIPEERVRTAARKLFDANTSLLTARGAKDVTAVL
jgi:hypothetical protein